jgi:Uma2 family endonuclease
VSMVLLESVELEIPAWVTSRAAFRQWVHGPDVDEKQKPYWMRGQAWVDMSSEQIYSHIAVKGEVFRILATLARDLDLGEMLQDGVLFSNDKADLSVNPDAAFVSHDAIETGRVALVEGSECGFVEIQGTPEMILEVVSRSSVRKDTKLLFEDYWKAGVLEYWIIDARKTPAKFELYRHASEGYVSARKRDGWSKSAVFGRQFRFIEGLNRIGKPRYSLEVR